ncbi:MAG: heparinase II/III-family protein [Ignavibacteriales bacterium]|nr:heparinase II/III-family protein [Ignavibacteriales bacterium]
MSILEKIQLFGLFSVKRNLFRRDIEAAFYANKEYRLPDFISPAIIAYAGNYISRIHGSFQLGITAWREANPSGAVELALHAEKILSGNLRILQKEIKISSLSALAWNTDYFSSFIYPDIPAWKINPEEQNVNAEAAVPLILGRLHFCTTLAVMYNVNSQERFAETCIDVLRHFKQKNRMGIGIQWHDNSEVAIRAVNLFYIIVLLHGYLQQQPEIFKELLSLFFSHAVFLESSISRERFTDHKTLITLLALFLSGTIFAQSDFGRQLVKKSIQQFEQEVRKQVFPDGAAYFHSLPSHCLLVEVIQLLKLHCRFANVELTSHLKQTYHLLNKVLGEYIHSDGAIPNVGDDVPAGILQFDPTKKTPDTIELLNTAFYINPKRSAVWPALKPTLNHYIHFPAVLIGNLSTISTGERAVISSGLIYGGHYMLRNAETSIFVKAAEIGKHGHGAPGHNDSFTFELLHKGVPFIVDSGTYSYYANSELRNALRSVMFHNTFYIDLTQLAEFVGTTGIKTDLTKPSVLEWKTDDTEDLLSAQHFAYIRLNDPVICKRTFHFKKDSGKLKIKDEFMGGAGHILASSLHLHPEVMVTKETHLQYLLTNNGQSVRVQYFIANDSADVEIQEVYHSPTYGKLGTTQKLHLRYQENLPAFYVMEISLL